MARLENYYKQEIIQNLMGQFGYKSVMQVPKLTKITLNLGVGGAVADKKILQFALSDMDKISGQKPSLHLPGPG